MSYQFGSDRPKLDARLQGAGVFTATANSTTQHNFSIPFNCLFNGLQCHSEDSHFGDSITLEVQYYTGAAWKRYKRFGKNWYLFKNVLLDLVLFPAEPKSGMRIAFFYHNTGNTDVHFAANVFTFVDQVVVNPANGEEGADW